MTGAAPLGLSGAVAACALLVAVAGAGKLWPGTPPDPVCRLLRVPPRWCPVAGRAAGAAELGAGAAVLAGAPAGDAVLAALGAIFVLVTVRARRAHPAAGCGCLPWRRAERAVTWRTVARAGCVLGLGAAGAAYRPEAAAARPGFVLGALAGGCVLAALSAGWPPRSPRCRRPLWRSRRHALGELRRHPLAETMGVAAAGPAAEPAAHWREGCADRFWFPAPAGSGAGVLFTVTRLPGGSVAVQAGRSGDWRGPAATGRGRGTS